MIPRSGVLLTAAFLSLTGIGLTCIYSAHLYTVVSPERQLLAVAFGLGTLWILMHISYLRWTRYSWSCYLAAVVCLVLVLAVGRDIRGAKRWISLAGFPFQPSQMMEVALLLVLARYLRFREGRLTARHFITALALLFLPMGLIMKQPDLGSSLVLVPVTLAMLLVSGAKPRYFTVFFALLLLVAIPFYTWGLQDYQRKRLSSFVNPEAYARKESYQLMQSIMAVGNGGWLGKGWGRGEQNRFNYLPDRHTDFVFAIVAEEWGLLGVTVLLFLYLLIFFECFRIAYQTREPFGRLLAAGVGTLWVTHVFINVGMCVGLAPVTGLTLPLVSYGGCSFITMAITIGLVLSVNRWHVLVVQ